MRPIENFLARLPGPQKKHSSQILAHCPAHKDKRPSLSIKETSDGVVLLKCFAGCSAADVTRAVGLELKDLFPRKGAR